MTGNASVGTEAGRLLAAVEASMAATRYCWLGSAGEAPDFNIRPMGRLPPDDSDAPWLMRFVTDGRSRKAAEVRRAPRVTVVFQNDAGEAYIKILGDAVLRERISPASPLWRKHYNVFFATERDRAHACFIEIEMKRIECWIRGVTPEPFGVAPSVLEIDGAGEWGLVSD